MNVGPGPIFFDGWVKYFKFNSDEMNIQRPNSFFKNLEFYDQQKKIPKANLMENINGEYRFIHKKPTFTFLSLMTKSILLVLDLINFNKHKILYLST